MLITNTDNCKLSPEFLGFCSVYMQRLKNYDPITYYHSMRVAESATLLGEQLGLSEDYIAQLRIGAMLHDIGKLSVPKSIILKPDKLDDHQRSVMENHPYAGYKLIEDICDSKIVLNCILKHHEKLSGKGYPLGLDSDDIPLEARIVSICDIYDALAFDRPYKRALPFPKIESILIKMAKDKEIDKMLTRTFLSNFSHHMRPYTKKISVFEEKKRELESNDNDRQKEELEVI